MITVQRRTWPGQTAVVLGCGPSLTGQDVDLCRANSLLVVAVNDAWRLAADAEVLYSSDIAWWRQYAGMPDFAGLKYSIHQDNRNAWRKLPADIQLLENTGDVGLETAPSGLRTISNSGGAAINLAVHLGARRIILLGFDMRPSKQVHFFGRHPDPLRNLSPYAVFLGKFATMVQPLRAAGVDVVNCTPDSALRCFRQAPLVDVLARVAA